MQLIFTILVFFPHDLMIYSGHIHFIMASIASAEVSVAQTGNGKKSLNY